MFYSVRNIICNARVLFNLCTRRLSATWEYWHNGWITPSGNGNRANAN